ncbi:MAG: type II toxin-antitoxin system RelE/ParE family toxin [Gammaproteobacteria bacterium]
MIKSWKHRGLERFFKNGDASKIQAAHIKRLRNQLAALNAAVKPEDMNLPGWDFHKLTGRERGSFAVKVNGNWRLTFYFEGQDAILVDYLDYH